MAYAESTIGGNYGNSFRVWVNSIRTYDGSPAENYEQWRVEGGINRVSATGNRIYSSGASYTTQLGMNGVAISNRFNYDFNTATGVKVSWGTGTTTVYRNAAGQGFGFQSRTDVNLNNGPYLTSGWVVSNDGLITRYRHASLTALSMDVGGIPATDEGPMWLEFSNPSGNAVDAFIDAPTGRVYTSPPAGSRYNFDFSGGLPAALQQSSPNSNTFNINIGVHDNVGGDSWDYRSRTVTIKNDLGQANPTFSNFTYLDTDGSGYTSTVAVTGSNQVLIQGKSTLRVTVPLANKATPNKYATMSSYTVSIGGYSQSVPWSNTADVVQDVGYITSDADVGAQNISVRAVDSRGNSTTVSKPVTVLPYASPDFFTALKVQYTNQFDASDGLTVTGLDDNSIAFISPMTLNGVDKNVVNPVSGVSFDISKGEDPWTNQWTNVATTQQAGTGLIRMTDPNALATAILNKMNSVGADNTDIWFVLFQINDKLETQYAVAVIDIGRPIMRIGADGLLYHKEKEFSTAFNPTDNIFIPPAVAYGGFNGGTWDLTVISGSPVSPSAITNNATKALNNFCVFTVFLSPGTYTMTTWFARGADAPMVTFLMNGSALYSNFDLYNATTTNNYKVSLNGLIISEGGNYDFGFQASSKNASSTGYYLRVFGLSFYKTEYYGVQ